MKSPKIQSRESVTLNSDNSYSTERLKESLFKRKMSTTGTGLAVVGGGLVAWQVYSITSNHNTSKQTEKSDTASKLQKKFDRFSDKPEL